MSEPPRSVRIVSVVPLDDLHVRLDFDDGAERTIDLTPLLQGNAFKQIRLSEKYFRTVHLESGSLVWDNGILLDADLLRYGPPKPPKPEKPKPEKPKIESKAKKPAAKPVTKVAAKAKAKPVAKAPVKKLVKAISPAKAKPAKPAAKAKAKAAKPTKKPAKPAKKKR